MKSVARLAGAVLIFGAAFFHVSRHPEPPAFELNQPPRPSAGDEPLFEVSIASSGITPSVHSATTVELSDGRIRAFWYGGSREVAKDVSIHSAVHEPSSSRWSPEEVVATRGETQSDVGRYVKKLGNPVVARGGDGRLWLFYVSVSVGGWSGSAINFRTSDDEGQSWSPARRLVTSPFLNISTLVRGPAVRFEDGSLGLPVYHEFLAKFGELLRIGADGRVIDKARMFHPHAALQPVVVPLEPLRALGFLRKSGDSPARVLTVETRDGGTSWIGPGETSLRNPDAAIAVVRTDTGELLMAFNDSETDRSNLSLAWSASGEGDDWRVLHTLPEPAPSHGPPRFAYPWLLQGRDGVFHLLYTWNREQIVHVRFDREWLLRDR